MLLPRVLATALALRQSVEILPSSYCKPQCPACLTNIKEFDNTTSCIGTSPFITNCGGCQTCVINTQYSGTVDRFIDIQSLLTAQLGRCAGTNASVEVAQYSSQASKNIAAFSTLTNSSPTSIPTSSDASTTSAAEQTATATALSSLTSTSSSSSETASAATGPGPQLPQTWIAGPVIGSILGMSTVFMVIYCTRRKQRREEEWELGNFAPKEVKEEDEESGAGTMQQAPEDNDGGKAQLHSDCIPVKEMENTEVVAPVELPALEPVGQEMLTPRGDMENNKDWPLPISPLPALFASAEIRDERMGVEESPKHETFYHP